MLEALLSLDQKLTLAVNGGNSLFFDGMFSAISLTYVWLPMFAVLFYVVIRNHSLHNAITVLLLIGLCVLFSDQVSSSLFKPYFHRFRPSHNPQIMLFVDIVNGYRGGLYGFFSSHAANTFSLATFVSLLIRRKSLTISLFLWALLNCWSRVYLGVHYLGDVLVGVLWGSLVGVMLYFLLKFIERKSITKCNLISSSYTLTGYSVRDADLLSLSFSFCLIFVIFKAILFSI